MNGAVRVWRTIMQYIFLRASAGFANLRVNPHLLPRLEQLRLVLRQVRLHGETGFRKIQRLLKFERLAHRYSGNKFTDISL